MPKSYRLSAVFFINLFKIRDHVKNAYIVLSKLFAAEENIKVALPGTKVSSLTSWFIIRSGASEDTRK